MFDPLARLGALMKKRLCILVLALIPIAGIVVYAAGSRFELIALEAIRVQLELGAKQTTIGKSIGVIELGQSVPIVNCHDMKHYVGPEVTLPGGQTGYIYDGQYTVRKVSHLPSDCLFNPFYTCSLLAQGF